MMTRGSFPRVGSLDTRGLQRAHSAEVHKQPRVISRQEPDLVLHRHPSGKAEGAARAEDVYSADSGVSDAVAQTAEFLSQGKRSHPPPIQRDVAVAPTI